MIIIKRNGANPSNVSHKKFSDHGHGSLPFSFSNHSLCGDDDDDTLFVKLKFPEKIIMKNRNTIVKAGMNEVVVLC